MKSEPLPKCCRSGCVPPPPGLLGFLHRSLALKTNKKNKRKEEKNEHTCQSLSTVQHTSRNKRAHTPSYPEFIQHTQRKKKKFRLHSTQNLSLYPEFIQHTQRKKMFRLHPTKNLSNLHHGQNKFTALPRIYHQLYENNVKNNNSINQSVT